VRDKIKYHSELSASPKQQTIPSINLTFAFTISYISQSTDSSLYLCAASICAVISVSAKAL